MEKRHYTLNHHPCLSPWPTKHARQVGHRAVTRNVSPRDAEVQREAAMSRIRKARLYQQKTAEAQNVKDSNKSTGAKEAATYARGTVDGDAAQTAAAPDAAPIQQATPSTSAAGQIRSGPENADAAPVRAPPGASSSQLGQSRPLVPSNAGDEAGSNPRSTSAASTTAAATSDASAYQPSVSTWGVFPRPADISKTYGGGRTLRPGAALESAEAAAARTARIDAALAQYRRNVGLDVDPDAAAAAQKLVDSGAGYFRVGQLQAALAEYQAAGLLVPMKSAVGGDAALGAALSLDSLGRGEEAAELYKALRSHRKAEVAKVAARMLFGFKAAEKLKVASMGSLSPASDWTPFFQRIARQDTAWGAAGVPAPKKAAGEESAGSGGLRTRLLGWGVATALASPCLWLAWRVYSHQHGP
ncbi:CPLD68 [Auxenochlorella protothecoides x Auxenochlorella symbiontica]